MGQGPPPEDSAPHGTTKKGGTPQKRGRTEPPQKHPKKLQPPPLYNTGPPYL